MTNDQVILGDLLGQRRAEIAPTLNESEFFELFSAEQILKDYDLSWDEIGAGIVGGGSDGGIDSVFLFINGILVHEDTDVTIFKSGEITIDLYILQSKRTAGFSEDAVRKLRSASEDLLDLTKDLGALGTVYNTKLLDKFGRFRQLHRKLASKLPTFRIHFYYVTIGSEVHPNVWHQVDSLKTSIERLFSHIHFSFDFLGASHLLELTRRRPRTTFELRLADSPIAAEKSYVALVRLRDYASFIMDENGNLRKYLFEANVRDYQGDIQVNEGIRNTLKNPQGEDFWWLNNGITVVVSKAVLSSKTLTLENPQIVNGHQTSVEIFNHFRSATDENDRCILVRILEPDSEASHQRIIRATNSQTEIPVAFLRATDDIHRDIEDFFKPRGLYYDRRKNAYKNEGKPREQIVGVPFLAQAVMAVLLGRPNDARARPSTLLKSEKDYRTVFDHAYPLETYLRSVEVLRKVEGFLRQHSDGLSAKEVNNLKFHLAYFVTRSVLGKVNINAKELAELSTEHVDQEQLERSYRLVKNVYDELGADDKVAKGVEFVDKLGAFLRTEFSSPRLPAG